MKFNFDQKEYNGVLDSIGKSNKEGKNVMANVKKAAKMQKNDVHSTLDNAARYLFGEYADRIFPILKVAIDEETAIAGGKSIDAMKSLCKESQLIEPGVYGMQSPKGMKPITNWDIDTYVICAVESVHAPGGCSEDDYRDLKKLHDDDAALAAAVAERKTELIEKFRTAAYASKLTVLENAVSKAKINSLNAKHAKDVADAGKDAAKQKLANALVKTAEKSLAEAQKRLTDHQNHNNDGTWKEGFGPKEVTEPVEAFVEVDTPKTEETPKAEPTLDDLIAAAKAAGKTARQIAAIKGQWTKAHKA